MARGGGGGRAKGREIASEEDRSKFVNKKQHAVSKEKWERK
jgi:hypothetical protein